MVGWMKCPFGLNKQMTGWTKCPFGWMTGWIQGKLLSSTSLLYLATVRSYCPSGLRGSFILPLLYVIAMDIQTKLKKGGTQNVTFIGFCKKVFKD
jgi:hypothetical protein